VTTIAWEMTHAVETNASPAFAWNYWTDVANWDDPPAKFDLDGSFAGLAGPRGCRGRSRWSGSSEGSLPPTRPPSRCN